MGGRGSSSGLSNNQISLPKLRGSEKQIAWAEDIRNEAIRTADLNIESSKKRMKEYGDSGKALFGPRLEAYKQVKANLLNALSKMDDASKIIDKSHIISGDTVNKEATRIEAKIREKRKK